MKINNIFISDNSEKSFKKEKSSFLLDKSVKINDKLTSNNLKEDNSLIIKCSNNDDSSEEIDMTNYNKDMRQMIISEKNFCDIISNNVKSNSKLKLLSNAFRYMRVNKFTEFRKIICKNKSIINNKYNKTFLIHEACKKGDPDYIALLLFLGAKCSIIDDHGMMAQHYAVKSGSIIAIDILSLFGNSMNVKDKKENTPMYYAIMNKNEEMIKTLMIYKADPTIKPLINHDIDNIEDDDFLNCINEYIKNF
jgi:ankyrin repeat protein